MVSSYSFLVIILSPIFLYYYIISYMLPMKDFNVLIY